MDHDRTRELLARYPGLLGQLDAIECLDGWTDLIDRLCADIVRTDPSVVATQVKEKYGGLRFYVSPRASEVVRALIDRAGGESLTLCEKCGADGRLRNETTRLQTRCDACWSR